MANDAAFRSSLLWLALAIVVVGVCTHSFKKMLCTYVVGMVGIAGVLLPDWDFFDRDFSRWTSPITAEERAAISAGRTGFKRYRIYPIRLVLYSLVYSYAIYRWWLFVSR